MTVTLAEGSLVSNIGQGSTETHLTTTARSQRFRAGSNEAGYILTGVDVVSGGTHSFTAKVCGVASNNNPTSTCTDLTPQGSFAAGTMSFSAPPNITLSKGTTYAVVLTPVGSFMNYGRTTSEREDKGKQPGSSIANEFEYLTSQTNIWTENPAFSVRIAIKGTLTPPPSTDATLSALSVTGGGSELITDFTSGTLDYSASVGNSVDEVTFAPTTNHGEATVQYFDAEVRVLTDADDMEDGFQIELAVGSNYDPIVGDGRRRHQPESLHRERDAGGGLHATWTRATLWCGVVTVGDITNNDGPTLSGHGFLGTTGGLTDETFSLIARDRDHQQLHD